MQKILTAMDNINLNKNLSKCKDFNVYNKDIQYREGIIEILKKENDFDIIIIYENLKGNINLENLIEEIKKINNKIKLIFILEKENKLLENLLLEKNIKNIFYNNKINFDDFINEIKKLEFNKEEILKKEIINLKKIIENKNNEILKYKNNYNIKIKNKLNNKNKINNKIIILISEDELEKEIFIKNIIFYLENKKILLFNFNIKINNIKKNNKIKIINLKNKKINKNNYNNEINKILNKLKKQYDLILINLNKNINEKIIFNNYEKIIIISKLNLLNIKKLNNLINIINSKYFLEKNKINILFNYENKLLINKKILKNIFNKYKIIGFLNLNNKNNLLINEKNKYKKIINYF